MPITLEDQRAFELLELRINTILPEEYQDRYDEVQPVSMGSASLKYGRDGKVLWSDIWDTFCDLAMAGGPPHRGELLEPGSPEEIAAHPDEYKKVVAEICRGIRMVTDLAVNPSPRPGWVGVHCESDSMAGWLTRAIVMENVSARCEGSVIDLPAGPGYRIEKEVKNVITAIAKTCHYWAGHLWSAQQRVIAELFTEMAAETPLIQPAQLGPDFRADQHLLLRRKMAAAFQQATWLHQVSGLQLVYSPCIGWLGVDCRSVKAAIWMMRAMVVSNVLSRREETVLFVPVNPATDPDGETVVRVLARVHGFAKARGIL